MLACCGINGCFLGPFIGKLRNFEFKVQKTCKKNGHFFQVLWFDTYY